MSICWYLSICCFSTEIVFILYVHTYIVWGRHDRGNWTATAASEWMIHAVSGMAAECINVLLFFRKLKNFFPLLPSHLSLSNILSSDTHERIHSHINWHTGTTKTETEHHQSFHLNILALNPRANIKIISQKSIKLSLEWNLI